MNIQRRAMNIASMCSEEGQKWKKWLYEHLALLGREGLISLVESAKNEAMPPLDIILIFISPSLYSSEKALNAIDYALDHRQGNQRIIGILVRDVEHKGRLGKLEGLPRNGKPLEEWNLRDKPLSQIAAEIRAIAEGRG